MTVKPTKKAKRSKNFPHFLSLKKIGRANPKANMVVVEGKEKELVCQGPIILTFSINSNGLEIRKIGFKIEWPNQ